MSKPIVEAIELFPIRVQPKSVKAKPLTNGSEVNHYDPAAKEATIPVGDNAYERTVRLHESLHALYSSGRVAPAVVAQTAEDLRLHLNKAKLEGQPRRDEITSAIRDLRTIALVAPAPERSWKMKDIDDELLGVFLRGVAILQGHSGWTPSSKATRYSNLIKRAYAKIDCKNKAKLGQSLKRAFEHIGKKDAIADAVKVLSPHFTNPDKEPKGGGGLSNPLMEMTTADSDGWGWGKDFEFDKIEIPPQLGRKLNQTAKELEELAKKKLIPTVRMHRLALTHPKKSDKGPITIMTFSGAKIRAKRLAAAMTSPIPVRLFKRRRINTKGGAGGTILIDGSGSMNIEDQQLDELMELCPMGSIAYYDGVDDGSSEADAKAGGDITIVAERGKQCDLKATKKLRPERNGANQIDLQAMQWMFTQPKPWYFLTDGGFTGACREIAKALLLTLLETKQVTQVRSVAEMSRILHKLSAEDDNK